MDDLAQITEAAHAIATAIEKRDDRALQDFLAPDFRLHKPGAATVAAAEFVASVRDVPAEMEFVSVHLEHLEIELAGDTALATGIQHARVRLDGETIDDRRPFVDWFVRSQSGRWQLRVAVDFPDE
jgi:ketosteroid isomerase-like protein